MTMHKTSLVPIISVSKYLLHMLQEHTKEAIRAGLRKEGYDEGLNKTPDLFQPSSGGMTTVKLLLGAK